MRRVIVVVLALALACYLFPGGGWERYERYRVRSALGEAGFSDKRADCMARRMTKRLSLVQLWKLQRWSEETRTGGAYLRGVRRVGDAQAVAVTLNSAALCATGLAD